MFDLTPHHVGISIPDLDAAIAWYGAMLGFTVERQMEIVVTNPTERLERGELRARIDEAMKKLSHEHRTVLVLCEFEEMEYKEIAKTMECSIGTVMSVVLRAAQARGDVARFKRKD